MLNLTAPPPLGLYIHTPWCIQKCPYCDFNSHTIKAAVPEARYLQALLSDLQQDLPLVWGRRIQSVFIGGGTPSVLTVEFYEQLFSQLRALLMISANAEITLEANPGAVDYGKFQGLRNAGINRLSIGIQSFNDAHLQQLGRIHSSAEARTAFDAARAAGFDNINLDLMFGLPGQSPEQAMQDLEQALALAPEHLSYYQLTLEPNTLFAAHPPVLPSDDDCWEIQQQAQRLIAAAGYRQYEVSAYALPGRQCSHNLNYWEFGDYLGIGAGAHSKLTDVNQHRVLRRVKEKHPQAYMDKASLDSPVIENRHLQRRDIAFEFMLNALRLSQGFAGQLFEQRTGLSITQVEQTLREAELKGLLQWDLDGIRASERGAQFLNDLVALFLPDTGQGRK